MTVTDAIKRNIPSRTLHELTWTRVRLRSLTSPIRMLPNLLIIGAMRSGTSSLYKYLGQCQLARPSLRKEVRYFTDFYNRGPVWYRRHFPLNPSLFAPGRGEPCSFEASPDYLLHPLAAERAAATVPDAKLVVLLRDPVDRAFSHYKHMKRLGFEPLSFEDALAAEEDRICPDIHRITADPNYRPTNLLRYSYAFRSRYAEQLDQWLRHYRRSQLLAIKAEDFYRNPLAVCSQIASFVGLPPIIHSDRIQTNRNYSYPQNGTHETVLDRGLRKELAKGFSWLPERLEQLLGPEWGDPWPETFG